MNNQGIHSTKGNEPKARQKILEINFAHFVARSLHVAAKLNIADHLKNSPKTIDELAAVTNADKNTLYRVMRILVTHNMFDYTTDNKFTLNETSQLLVSDHPHSLRDAVAKELDTKRWNAVGQLLKSLHTGKPAFNEEYGQSFYEYLEETPEAKARFDAGMGKYSKFEDEEVASLFDFSPYKKIVDIGSGQGSLIAQILTRFPNSQAILFDLPGTVENHQYVKNDPAFDGRYQVIGGSFFDSIPEGGDVYILKRVIHNWNDADAVKILKNCSQQLKPSSRILIIDCVEEPLSHNTEASPFIDGDIIGVTIGGHERTKAEFEKIIEKADLQIVAIHQSPNIRIKIIEVKSV